MSHEGTESTGSKEDEQDRSVDPKIAHHSTYIEETKQILRRYAEDESFEDLKRAVVEDNILNKDTDEYRMNILREVTRRYIADKDDFQRTPLMQVMTAEIQDDIIDWCLYYEFAQDPFIRLLTLNFLYPKFESGALGVQKDDVVEYLDAIQDDYADLRDRSEATKKKAATHYLTALKNFGLLEGTKRKEFAVVYIPDETIAYVVYRLFQKGAKSASEVIEHEDWQLLLMDPQSVQRRLRDISPQYITYEKRGSTERFTKNHDTLEALINEF